MLPEIAGLGDLPSSRTARFSTHSMFTGGGSLPTNRPRRAGFYLEIGRNFTARSLFPLSDRGSSRSASPGRRPEPLRKAFDCSLIIAGIGLVKNDRSGCRREHTL